jgi:hypothetical protein
VRDALSEFDLLLNGRVNCGGVERWWCKEFALGRENEFCWVLWLMSTKLGVLWVPGGTERKFEVFLTNWFEVFLVESSENPSNFARSTYLPWYSAFPVFPEPLIHQKPSNSRFFPGTISSTSVAGVKIFCKSIGFFPSNLSSYE